MDKAEKPFLERARDYATEHPFRTFITTTAASLALIGAGLGVAGAAHDMPCDTMIPPIGWVSEPVCNVLK